MGPRYRGAFPIAPSYTPKHLAEKILTSKSALEGERKQVTVLFADRKGSMELLADRDPEEARKLLDPVLEHTFKHALTHEVTYSSLLQERRRTLHARIVEGIEARYPGRLAEPWSGVWSKAPQRGGSLRIRCGAPGSVRRTWKQAGFMTRRLSRNAPSISRAGRRRGAIRRGLSASSARSLPGAIPGCGPG